MEPSTVSRRVRLALFASVVALAVMVLAVTPYNLRDPGLGMPHPYNPPPLDALEPFYRLLRELTPALPLAALVGAGLAGGLAFFRLGRRAGNLVLAVGLAVAGQAYAINGLYSAAGLLYALAAVSFGAWAWVSRARLAGEVVLVGWPRRAEWGIFTVLMLATFLARFYEIGRIPYGIEGDEAKWTAEVVGVMIDHTQVLSSDWHFGGVPGSFYMQAPFHRLMGPGVLSGRIAVAAYSVLASALFYLFVRVFFNVPLAVLATGLMSVSMLDLSASRLALVEGHTKLWVIAGPALLMLALRRRRVWLFALAGGAFGLGIVTYDTYLPMLGVGGAVLFVDTALHLSDWRGWLWRWLAFGLALGGFFGRAWYYIGGRGGDYKLGDVGWTGAPVETFFTGLGRTLRVFCEQVDRCFLHMREGPLINSVLIPFVVVGAVGCLVLWRRRWARLPLIWAVLTIFPVPVVLQIAYPRVLYPALPALYLLAALGLYWVLRAVWGEWGRRGRTLMGLALAAGAAVYPVYNLYIYFNAVQHDDAYRVTVREMGDYMLHYAEEGRLILVPYMPLSGDLVEHSGDFYNFYLRQVFANGTQSRFYRILPYRELLPTMTRTFETGEYNSVGILVDTNVPEMEPRDFILDNLRACYREDAVWARDYTRMMLFSASEQVRAPCYGAHAELALSEYAPVYRTGEPPRLYWSVSEGTPLQAALACERERGDVRWVEAEDFDERQFYRFRPGAVAGASGRGVLADEPGGDIPLASVTLTLPQAGRYTVWARTYRIRSDGYPLYLAIEGSEPQPLSGEGVPLGKWVWETVGPFDLEAGEVYAAVTRPYTGEKPFAVYFDALVFAADEDFMPEDPGARWEPYLPGEPEALPVPGVRQGIFPPVEWEPGVYRCRAGAWDGDRMRDGYGLSGVWSAWVDLVFSE